MTQSIHGHEVLHFMLENPEGFTRESLKTAVIARFGAEARFHTCSAQDMDTDALIEFLAQKGKFIENGGSFNTREEHICNHGDEHDHVH